METSKYYSLDVLLVPINIFLITTYHIYLWHSSRSKPHKTSIGAKIARQTAWLQSIIPVEEKKGTLGIQTFRNALLESILSATVAIAVNAAMAAVANNAYTSHVLLSRPVAFGSQKGSMLVFKYASACLLLLLSFLCSSMAVGCIIEAGFLLSTNGRELFVARAEVALMKGCVLAVVGNRVLFVAISYVAWMFGPVAFAMSTMGMLWVFYVLDFQDTRLKLC
ncbi:hypothetical protein HPP92_001665 [Vanilla planifolia]|uniref:Uncharacterized protein n=1 Tax=Vanilla planifolia TaxID=51239 RepID=A0A835VDR9_VANPL|nr:hypothetical protein HPP92_001665 [Vanilla planifolia]